MSTATVTPVVEMDQFGRTEDERTIVLDSVVAEQVNDEVVAGNHDTYVDALNYVIERGFAEIARTRAAQAKAKADKQAGKALKSLTELLSQQPALVTDAGKMTIALKAKGIYTPEVVLLLTNMGCKLK